jgi:hypothetical protein
MNLLDTVLKKAFIGPVIFLFTIAPTLAQAAVWIQVPDASQLQYQTQPDGKVYLRNVTSFDPNATCCNYIYYIDTTTVEGKLLFTIMLTAAARGSKFWFAVPTGYAPGAVTQGGDW